jgi:hypothetical protein
MNAFMKSFRILVAASAVAAIASVTIATPAPAAPLPKESGIGSVELSAAKRVYHRRYVRYYARPYHVQPYYSARYSAYRRGSDPGLGPDGLPYAPPPYLRGQCHVDEGYGRFSACSNR